MLYHLLLHFLDVTFFKLGIKEFVEHGFGGFRADHRVQRFTQLHAVPLTDIRLLLVRIATTVI